MSEQPNTECLCCGGRVNAGVYPPYCSKWCEFSIKVEVEFERMAKEDSNHDYLNTRTDKANESTT